MPSLRIFSAAVLALPALLAAGPDSVPLLQPSGKRVKVMSVSNLVFAIGSVSKGTSIMLEDGVYDLSKAWPLRIRTDSLQLYGASRDPSKVILKGAGFASSDPDEELIKIEAVGVKLAYFTLRDGRGNGVKLQTGGNDGLFIHNVHFLDICERSIKGPEAPVSRDGVVQYCRFEQTAPITEAIPNLHMNGDYVAGMDMMRIEGWSIHHNVFKNIRGMHGEGRAAVFLWNGCKRATVERNVFIGCDRSISFGNPNSGNLDMEGGVIRNNFIVAGKDISIEVCNSAGSVVAFNTIYSANPGFGRTICFFNNREDNVVKNNLVLGKMAVLSGRKPDAAGNLFHSSAAGTAAWFRDAPRGDLHLTSAAAHAIGKAVPLAQTGADFDGETRGGSADIGADQTGASGRP
jgi:hypothetical protein